MPAKPLRLALGSLIIQKQYDYSDRELVEQLTENPYYQFLLVFQVINRNRRLHHRFW